MKEKETESTFLTGESAFNKLLNKLQLDKIYSDKDIKINDCFSFINTIFESFMYGFKENYIDRTSFDFGIYPREITAEDFFKYLDTAINKNLETRESFFKYLDKFLLHISEETSIEPNIINKLLGIAEQNTDQDKQIINYMIFFILGRLSTYSNLKTMVVNGNQYIKEKYRIKGKKEREYFKYGKELYLLERDYLKKGKTPATARKEAYKTFRIKHKLGKYGNRNTLKRYLDFYIDYITPKQGVFRFPFKEQ